MAEHNELTIDIRTSGDAATVHCGGRLTVTSSSQLRVQAKRLLPQTRSVTLDLTNITLMDSVGLGTIAALYASVRTAGGELQVVNISPRIREYPRSATTVMSTQIGPTLRDYLNPLSAELEKRGLRGPLLIMQGSGGSVSAHEAPAYAITTIGSVLTGGVIGARTCAFTPDSSRSSAYSSGFCCATMATS